MTRPYDVTPYARADIVGIIITSYEVRRGDDVQILRVLHEAMNFPEQRYV